MKRFLLGITILCTLCSLTTHADQWPQWRGPQFNGVAQGTGFPVEWGPEKNIAWKFKLSERGSSTPAVWNNHIFLTGAEADKNIYVIMQVRSHRGLRVGWGRGRVGGWLRVIWVVAVA